MSTTDFTQTLTVLATATVSDIVIGGASQLAGVYPIGIGCPSAFDGTLFRIQCKYGANWRPIRDTKGADFTFTLSALGMIPISNETWKVLKGRQMRIVCATTQTADRVFEIIYENLG